MTRDEIVTALRCHCDAIETGKCPKDKCPSFERPARYKCASVVSGEAADLIENQQREIEALRQANEGVSGDEICRAALETFGKELQVTMAIEEMSELTKELCKNSRGQENTTHIAEEIADVEIMLQQMVMLFDCAGQVETFRRYKLERLAGRSEEAKEEKRGTTDV